MPSLLSYVFRTAHRLTRVLFNASTVHATRDQMDRAASYFSLPKDITITPVMANGVPSGWVATAQTPADRVILYLHGGAFNYGSSKSHRFIVAPLVKEANTRALLINYRLAPEHPFPAALDDCVSAYHWLIEQGIDPACIALIGDSAGGGLVVSTMLAARDAGLPMPAAGVCLSPLLDATASSETYQTLKRKDFALDGEDIRETLRNYIGEADPSDPLLSPVCADLTGLPPILIHVGSDEILLGEAIRFAGVNNTVTLKVWDRMWHVFQMYAALGMPEARRSMREIGLWVQDRMSGQKAKH